MVKKILIIILTLIPIFSFSQKLITPEIIGDLDSQKLNFIVHKTDFKKYKMSYEKLEKIFKSNLENRELLLGINFIFDCEVINISENKKTCLVKINKYFVILKFNKEITNKKFMVFGNFQGFSEEIQSFIFQNCEIL